MTFFYICLAGGFGTGLRHLLSQATMKILGPSIPFGTLFANMIGSFLMGLVMYLAINSNLISQEIRVVLTVGFLGGFTTYSSFNQDTLVYFDSGEILLGILYTLGMLTTCLFSGWCGVISAKIITNSVH